jgi:DNA-binding MarR family transcriptional regulator
LARDELSVARREPSNDTIVLGLLDAVERDPAVTQRLVARELGIALGLANAYLKRCVRKGLIKIGQVPRRRYAYFLTPRGISEKSRLTAAYLAHSFSFFREARIQCGQLFAVLGARGQRRLVLIGAGDLAEIAILVAREHPVEIAGIVAANADAAQLRTALDALGPVDGAVVTALEQPREVFAATLVVLGAERVHAPALLRVPSVAAAPAADKR